MALKSRLKALTPPFAPYLVKSWAGETVYLRGLTIGEYEQQAPLLADEGVNNAAVFRSVIAKCLADEAGALVFDDPDELGSLPLDGLFECYEEVIRRSTRQARVEQAKGN
jgi:hypothetical protein